MNAPQLFLVNGMTCQGCVAEIKGALEKVSELESVDLTLDPPVLELVGRESEIGVDALMTWLPIRFSVEQLSSLDTPEDRLREGLVQLGGPPKLCPNRSRRSACRCFVSRACIQ